ncbi:MAG: DDE-type integrase/transposase/recombinase, partial [Cytophagales bacterium]|nr:DDE-type integrase/transposase/recombinase [Cytophagales bacterium]
MNLLIFDTQRTHMGQLHNEIQNKLIEKSRYFNLSPFICSDGFIRSASRMKNAPLRKREKFPFLLLNDAPLVRLIVNDMHVRLGHAGIQHTLANLRKEVWILQGQRTVRRILSECRVCRRHKGGSYKMPLMAPLPKERLMRTKPFQYIGLDYFGPLVVKFNKENTKAWICLFTCCVTRAIHLEPVHSMNTKSFIGCLRRFIARRGQPKCIISDNAPQFLLASDTLKGLFASEPALDDDVFSYFAREGIQWKFITEFAPWQGGFYERMVGLAKSCLRKIIGRRYINVDELYTFVAETEAIVNSRPLNMITEERTAKLVCPIDLIQSNNKVGTFNLNGNIDDNDDPEYVPSITSTIELKKYWQKTQRDLNEFWVLWKENYLLALREKLQIKHN